MAGPLTPDETADIVEVGRGLLNAHVAEGLLELLSRERVLLENSDLGDGEARQITIHNMTILAAAAARIKELGGPSPRVQEPDGGPEPEEEEPAG